MPGQGMLSAGFQAGASGGVSCHRMQIWSGIGDLWTGPVSNSLIVIKNQRIVPEIPLFWHLYCPVQAVSPPQKLHQKSFGGHWVLILSSEDAVILPKPYSTIQNT